MRMRSGRLAALVSVLVPMMITSIVVSVGAASGAAERRPGTSPVRFLHRTAPVRVVGRPDRTPGSAPQGIGASDLAEGPYLAAHQREEREPGEEEERVKARDLPKAKSVPIGEGLHLRRAFSGIDHFQQRYSDSGNQFSGEPPDQGLCVGNGQIMEMANSSVQVYSTHGDPKIPGDKFYADGPAVGLSLNQFYGVPSSFVRPDGPFGPFMFDVVCLYDASTGHWYAVSDELDLDPVTSAFSGPSAIFVAVSETADALGSWNVYVIDTTNNGQNGTPDHGCSSGYCFGDYPQIGLDAHSFVISTNEFDNLGDGEFHGAQLYAFSKQDLAAGDPTPTNVYLQNIESSVVDDLAYTLQPANGLPDEWVRSNHGTMYFGMSTSPYERIATEASIYALSNTASLESGTPDLALTEAAFPTLEYSVPRRSMMAPGRTPLLHCVNIGVPCIGTDYPKMPSPLPVDSGSGKFYGSWIDDGMVYLTTSVGLQGTGAAKGANDGTSWRPIRQRVGIAYFGVEPTLAYGELSVERIQQGRVAVKGQNLGYPSIAVAPDGTGAIGVSLMGPDYAPSAAYIPFESGQRPDSVQIGLAGVGPNDGFSGTGEGGYRPRWGDYGTAVAMPDGSIWLAAEYTASTCGFAAFLVDTTCGYTRSFYANWATGIMRVKA